MPMTWGYVRVSDEAQLGRKAFRNGEVVNNTSIETQKQIILECWERHCHEYPDHQFARDANGNLAFWEDPAVSARKVKLKNRAQGSMMLAALCPGDIIIFWNLSRVFRDTIDFLEMMKHFQKMRVTLINAVTGEVLKWDTADAVMYGTIIAAMNQRESDIISERTKQAWASREKRGLVVGHLRCVGWQRRYTVDRVTGKRLAYNIPCEAERWWIRIFRWMKALDGHEWSRDAFRLYARRNNIRRGPKCTGDVWRHCYFQLAEYIYSLNFPQLQLVSSRQGYRRDRVNAEVVPVQRKRTLKPRVPALRGREVPLEALLSAPPGTTVTQLLRQLSRERAEQDRLEASREPCTRTIPLRSSPAS